MGVADSRFRDRVVFVEGAPRSGTSWLAALLSAHPAIAGIANEAHLFDIGVNRLIENHELSEPWQRYLSAYVPRHQLIDLVRDLCDGIFEQMRRETKPEASFVLEKSPVGPWLARVQTERKRECYPDAWYVHIVRDGQAVTRSLLQTPWAQDRTEEECARWWRDGVEGIREALSDHGRYRELDYDELRADPAAGCASLFGWIGLEYDDELLERMRLLSRETYAPHKPRPKAAPPRRPTPLRERLVARIPGRPRWKRAAHEPASRSSAVAADREHAIGRLVEAFSQRDEDKLHSLTTDSFELDLRTGEGDLRASGDAARGALAEVAHEAFRLRFNTQFWIGAVGEPFHSAIFLGAKGNGERVDLSFSILLEGDRISRMVLISAGSPGGRPLKDWRHSDSREESP